MRKEKKRVAIFGDTHLRYEKVEKDIKFENPDQIIFLGDEFDDWNDTPDQNKECAQWMKWSLNQKNRIHLMANHTISYCYSSTCVKCPGFTFEKDAAINSVLKRKDWDKLKWYYILDDEYLITHAGLDVRQIPPYFEKQPFQPNFTTIQKWLDKQIKIAKYQIACNHGHWLINAGFDRGGNHPIGGIFWADWNTLQPIPEVKQIIGHSYVHQPQTRDNLLNLDCHNEWYAICDGKTIEIKKSNL